MYRTLIATCLLLLGFYFQAEAQQQHSTPTSFSSDSIYDVVEVMPSFPGGEAELFRYLGKTLRYPATAKSEPFPKTLHVLFVVRPSGQLTDIEITRSSGNKAWDEHGLDCIRKMPDWIPGTEQGQAVPVRFRLPLRICLR